MKIIRIPATGYGSNCWLVSDEGQFVIIDPSSDIETIKDFIFKRGLNLSGLKYILLTHGHFDHLFGLQGLRDLAAAPVAIHKEDNECLLDSNKNLFNYFYREDITFKSAEILLSDNDTIQLDNISIKVIHTPGHTKGSVCYMVDDSIFTGDTLFDLSIGRTDLYGGNPATQINSLKKIMSLNPELKMYPGHGSISTLEKQFKYNEYLNNI